LSSLMSLMSAGTAKLVIGNNKNGKIKRNFREEYFNLILPIKNFFKLLNRGLPARRAHLI